MVDDNKYPLCVDLDGTLIRTDIMFESIFLLLRHNFLYIFIVPFWALRGRYYLKEKLAQFVTPDVDLLPYNNEVIRLAKKAHEQERDVYLVTASYHTAAEEVARKFPFFRDTFASKDEINLVGKTKAQMLEERFGAGNFDYIGDSYKDRYVWQISRKKILVDPDKTIRDEFAANDSEIIQTEKEPFLFLLLSLLRIYQWVKNLLVFLPMLLAHVVKPEMLISSSLAFISISLMASAIYIINDLFDIESDRRHADKRNRPIASGKFKILSAIKIVPVLIIFSLVLAYSAKGCETMYFVLLYFAVTSLYSTMFKHIYIADIIILAGLYTLRLLLGGIATDTLISHWLLSFSMFFFLSLAALKRFIELKNTEIDNPEASVRGYTVADIPIMMNTGIGAGLLSVLVYVLYINSPGISILYKNLFAMYLIAPVLLFWILRVWLIAGRGRIHHDPVVFALTDRTSHLALISILIFSVLGML